MSDHGYTLAEMLAALLIVGLAVGGLAQGLRTIARVQSGATGQLVHERDIRRAEAQFVGLLANRGPFKSTRADFTGDMSAFAFACGEARSCGARLSGGGLEVAADDGGWRRIALPAADVQFAYDGDGASFDHWPPRDEVHTLRAVRIVRGGASMMAARLWPQHTRDCDFDPIAQGCREAAP